MMLGWVIACHNNMALDIRDALEAQAGVLPQCCTVNFWPEMSNNMLSRAMCDALHYTDSGDGVIFLTDIPAAPPYRAAALLSHKHPECEVICGISLLLLQAMLPARENLSSEQFRQQIVELGGESVTSLWHQQQKNPPFVLIKPVARQ